MNYETTAPTLQYKRTYIVTYKDKYDVENWEQLLHIYKGWRADIGKKNPHPIDSTWLDHSVTYSNSELEAYIYVARGSETDFTPYADMKRLFAGEDLAEYRMGLPKDFQGRKTWVQELRSLLEPKRADRVTAMYTENLYRKDPLVSIASWKTGGIKLVVHITENICLVTHNSSLWSLEENTMRQLIYSIPENKLYLRDEATDTLNETKDIEIIRYKMPQK